MDKTRAQLQQLREAAKRQREKARRQREAVRRSFYDRATAFVSAFHYWQQLIGRQPK